MESDARIAYLREVVLVLENERAFYAGWQKRQAGFKNGIILDFHRQRFRDKPPLCGKEVAWIKEYFILRYQIPKELEYLREFHKELGSTSNPLVDPATVKVVIQDYNPETKVVTIKDNPMAKFFETKRFVNGLDVATQSVENIAAHIVAKEAEIKKLEDLPTKPVRITKAIAAHKAELKEFVDYLDSLEPKEQG